MEIPSYPFHNNYYSYQKPAPCVIGFYWTEVYWSECWAIKTHIGYKITIAEVVHLEVDDRLSVRYTYSRLIIKGQGLGGLGFKSLMQTKFVKKDDEKNLTFDFGF